MKYYIGCDIGGTEIKFGLVDSSGNILKKSSIPTLAQSNKEDILSNILNEIKKIQIMKPMISAIGIGSPGSVNTKKGIILGGAYNFKDWNDVKIREIINKNTSIPVYVDNDASNAARAEYMFGQARNIKNFISITLGTGIGGGIIINGKMLSGNSAGEIGHISINPDGLYCSCGSQGCVEAYASATATVKRAKNYLKHGYKSKLSKIDFTAKDISILAKKRDRLSILILKETGEYLGRAIAILINILNPELITVSGGFALSGNTILKSAIETAKKYSMPRAFAHVKIKLSRLKNNAGLLGAVALAIMEKEVEN